MSIHAIMRDLMSWMPLRKNIISVVAKFISSRSYTMFRKQSETRGRQTALIEEMIGGQKVILAKPQTFMNLSGESVAELLHYYKIDPEEELLVIFDDISLAPGNIRIRKKGSAGGHNGIKNIIAMTGTENFKRIKVGVGEKPAGWDLADHVLGRMSEEDRAAFEEAVKESVKAVEMILEDEIDQAMNDFNRKKRESQS
jgi:PTH1 family peptidyl-tRNA hydrolase